MLNPLKSHIISFVVADADRSDDQVNKKAGHLIS